MIESDGDGWKCRQEGDRKERLGGRERGVVGSRVEFAANERAFALVDLTRARGQMPSRVPLRPGGPKSPSLSLPSHRPLSPPPIIYLGTCICLALVDSKIALHHGETEDRHTTHNGPSFDLSPFFSFAWFRVLCPVVRSLFR